MDLTLGNYLVSKMFVMQTQTLSTISRIHAKRTMPSMVVCACDLSPGDTGTGRSLELAGQPSQPI